jgi:hypothetical protein
VNGDYTIFFRRGDSPPAKLGPGNAIGMTPDAKYVLAASVSGANRGLTLLPVGPGQPKRLDLGGVEFRDNSSRSVQFSSDGQRAAIVGGTPGEGRAAWVIDLAGGPPRRVSDEGATGAVISPDGTKVAVSDKTRGLYVVSAAGTMPLHDAPKTDVPLAWTSDGAAVLSWDTTLPPRIFKTDVVTGRRELFRELRPIDMTGAAYAWLKLSPDGRYYMQRLRRMRSAVVMITLHG